MEKMKNFWSLLTIIMVVMLSVGFVSCSSDDDKEEEQEQVNVLYGTKWQAEETLYPMIFGGGKTYAVIDFSSKNECEMYLTQQGNVVYDINVFKYAVNGDEVTFTKEDGSLSVYTISGRKMIKKSGSNIYSSLTEFIKQ